jgi:hypothetical protein
MMARPKSDDPKVALTIRLPASVLARLGENPRATLEALIIARDVRLTAAPKAEPPAKLGPFKTRLKGEWKAP